MQPEKTPAAAPHKTAEAPAAKQPYQSPKFTAFGSIAELTEGAGGTATDGGAGSNATP